MVPTNDGWVRMFIVSDPFVHKKGFTLYKVTSVVFPKQFPEAATRVVVWKRYNDFKKLYREMKTRHQKLHLCEKFPPFVKAKYFSRYEEEVVEERRRAAFLLLEFIAKFHALFTSDVFVKFFESGYSVNSEDGRVEQPDSVTGASESSSTASSLCGSVTHYSPTHPYIIQRCADSADVAKQSTNTVSDQNSHLLLHPEVTSPLQNSELQSFDPFCTVGETDNENKSEAVSFSQPTRTGLKKNIKKFKKMFSHSKPDQHRGLVEAVEYWKEAEFIAEQAKEREMLGDQQAAFALYKTAIACLLSGVQNDTDFDRRKAVKETTLQYLQSAEELANNQFAIDVPTSTLADVSTRVPLSQLWHPVVELKQYKVLSIMSNKVMLVLQAPSQTLFAIKPLHKMPCRADKGQRVILPRGVPYMVGLHALHETDSTVFLVLQHVSTGMLWDFVTPFFRKSSRYDGGATSQSFIPKLIPQSESASTTSSTSIDDSCQQSLAKSTANLRSLQNGSSSTISSHRDSYMDLIRDYVSEKTTYKVVEDTESIKSSEGAVGLPINDNEVSAISEASVDTHTSWHDRDLRHDGMTTEKRSSDYLADDVYLDTAVSTDLTLFNLAVDTNNDNNSDQVHRASDSLCHEVVELVSSSKTNSLPDESATTELIAKAQKLLKSVSETLQLSESLVPSSAFSDSEPDILRNVPSSVSAFEISPVELTTTKPIVVECSHILSKTEISVDSSLEQQSSVTKTDFLDLTGLYGALSHETSPLSSLEGEVAPRWAEWGVEGEGLHEHVVKLWAAQILTALSSLHQLGIVCRDLNPENLLVDSSGRIVLTYQCQFPGVDPAMNCRAVSQLYTAPELCSILPTTFAVDWWSLGTILYHLLTGQSLSTSHPGGIYCTSILRIPDVNVSDEAQSLLRELLQPNPKERLGSGLAGVDAIKSHPFFDGIEWEQLHCEGCE